MRVGGTHGFSPGWESIGLWSALDQGQVQTNPPNFPAFSLMSGNSTFGAHGQEGTAFRYHSASCPSEPVWSEVSPGAKVKTSSCAPVVDLWPLILICSPNTLCGKPVRVRLGTAPLLSGLGPVLSPLPPQQWYAHCGVQHHPYHAIPQEASHHLPRGLNCSLKTLAFTHLDYCHSFLSGLSASIILPPVARVIFLKPQI